MRYFFSILTVVAWGLWFGGVMALFLFIVQLNHTFAPPRREIFTEAAGGMIPVFERYQLVVGAIALIAAFAWRVTTPGSSRTLLFCLLALAAGAVITSSLGVTPRIEKIQQEWIHLREIEQNITVESQLQFRKLHGLSKMVYAAQAALLLAAGALLPLAARPVKQNA